MTSASTPDPDPFPASEGWRWPAEWEPHAATWLAWPHNPDTWPGGRLAAVERAYAAMVRALQPHEAVRINVGSEALEASARRALRAEGVDPDRNVRFHRIPSDDAWIRDHGPIFLVRGEGDRRERLLLDFRFDAWGGKYPPWDRDDAVPGRMAAQLGLPVRSVPWVLEGGAVDGNGRGTLLTTESCLLHPNRGPGRTREAMERRLAEALGARRVLWLGDGIAGDDTDGHVDDLARFVDAGTVVASEDPDEVGPDAAVLRANLERLRGMRDADGKPLAVATLPVPPPVRAEGALCPASYANFYVANGVVLLPVFDAPADARARAVLAELFPGRDVVGIPARELVVGLGAVHCLTQQEPA